MNTDGKFTIHEFRIDIEKQGEPIYLIPFGDVHRFAYMCDAERWKEFLSWAKTKKRCYFFGMGDYDDLASGSERAIIGRGNKLHESTQEDIENMALKRTEAFAKEIAFMKGKIVGMMGGNHFWEFASGITSDMKIAEILGAKYLGTCSFVRLNFFAQNHKRGSIDIFAHHGKAGGRLAGSPINTVQQMEGIADAQIYLQGHNHSKGAIPASRLALSAGEGGKPRLIQRKIWYIRTGSFLRGYLDGKASYVVEALMRPTDLGVVKIEMTPRNKGGRDRSFEIDLHVSS